MRPSSWVPPVAWMAIMTVLSSGWFSSQYTEGPVGGVLAWVAPWLSPADVDSVHAALRKGAHLAEYAILALLWFRAFARDTRLSRGLAVAVTFVICAGWAGLDEFHQRFVPSRTGSPRDVAIDVTGAFLALLVARRDLARTARALAYLLLWIAAGGGAIVLIVDRASGVNSGYLWLTVPAAALLLAARRWWKAQPRRP